MRFFAFFIFLIFAASVQAQEMPRFEPAIVAGLPENDTLNVRAGPATNFEILGELAEGTLVEVIDQDGSGHWGLIGFGEGEGWVSLRYLEPNEFIFTERGFPIGMQCFGTEPFWSYVFDANGTTIFETPERGLPLELPVTRVAWSENSLNGFAYQTDHATVILNKSLCSDGMVSRRFGWNISILERAADGALLQGCCKIADR